MPFFIFLSLFWWSCMLGFCVILIFSSPGNDVLEKRIWVCEKAEDMSWGSDKWTAYICLVGFYRGAHWGYCKSKKACLGGSYTKRPQRFRSFSMKMKGSFYLKRHILKHSRRLWCSYLIWLKVDLDLMNLGFWSCIPKKATRPLIIRAKLDVKTQGLTVLHLVDPFGSLIHCLYDQKWLCSNCDYQIFP